MWFLFCSVVFVAAFAVWLASRKRARVDRNPVLQTSVAVSGGIALVFLLIAVSQLFTVIPAGHVGVVDFFGVVKERPLSNGINLVNPLAEVHKFSVQTKEHKELMQVLSREGLTIGLEISVLYRLNPDSAARVYSTIANLGDYETIILVPQFRSISRSVTASFQASALYSTERERLGISIQEELARMINPKGVIVESTPLRNVALPTQLVDAIEQKQRADQESQRMQFILTKEKQEADRKRIEAQGISDFQQIVSHGISEQLLRWKGIEATEKLSSSQNAKIVIIGAGKTGLPVILDTRE